jgi:phosphate-selective porin OprO/OprP
MLHIGVAASYRTPKTSAEIENSYRFSSRSLTSINRKKYIDTDDILNVDNNILFNTELAASWKNIMLHGEMILNKINRTQENGGSAQIGGGFVQAGILLFGGQYVYNSTEGEFTQIDRGRNNKDLELAFRFDYMNANDFDAKIYGGAANGYTVALNYYLSSNVKLMLNYSYLDHDRYANGRGKLYIYKDEQGNLYKDPFEYEIPTGKGGDDFSIISARIEIDF